MRERDVVSGLVLVAGLALVLAGCETMGPNTQRGAAGGAVVGSIAGGVIGHQMGRGIEGALIGGTVGALGGGAVGSSIDDKQARSKEQILAGTEKLGISDVLALSKGGISDDQIIAKIQSTGSVYTLSVEEIEMLRREGVSARVVNTMMGTTR